MIWDGGDLRPLCMAAVAGGLESAATNVRQAISHVYHPVAEVVNQNPFFLLISFREKQRAQNTCLALTFPYVTILIMRSSNRRILLLCSLTLLLCTHNLARGEAVPEPPPSDVDREEVKENESVQSLDGNNEGGGSPKRFLQTTSTTFPPLPAIAFKFPLFVIWARLFCLTAPLLRPPPPPLAILNPVLAVWTAANCL